MKNIAIIDVEASGLHFDSYPIEIAVLKKGVVRSWLIKPENSWTYWCETAEGLHGITRWELERDGLPASEVVSQLNEFLADLDGAVYSDAERWDAGWVDTLYFAAQERRRFRIASIYDLVTTDDVWSFETITEDLVNSGRFTHHRAASDVKMIAEALELVLKKTS